METKLRALADDRGLTERAVFVGRVPDADLPAYYHACDLFVLPASHRSEAFGLVQLEAMACGKPVICTELGTGTSFVNVHGETGLVVPPRNPEALAAAINSLLADEPMRRRMGQRANERAKQFSAKTMIEKTMDLYNELMAT